MLREFASKRHVKLSRVTIRAKDDEEEKVRWRQCAGAGEEG